MHPDFPIVQGSYRLSPAWVVDLPVELNRRLDGDELVLWRAGLSLRFTVQTGDDDLAPGERIARERLVLGEGARDVEEEEDGDVARMTFTDDEEDYGPTVSVSSPAGTGDPRNPQGLPTDV